MAITPLPTPPLRSDGPTAFADRGDTFMAALPAFVTQANALEANVDALEASAVAAASTATTKATEASASADAAAANSAAPKWVSGTTYAIGDVRWSPLTYVAYRRKVDGGGTTDPSADAANWVQLTTLPVQTGAAGKFLTTNGSAPSWEVLPNPSYYQEFLTSGAWIKPADATWVYVEAIGGGASGVNVSGQVSCGGGGGAFNQATLRAIDLTTSVTVTVGAGGTASPNTSRLAGGASSFGGYLSSPGAPGGADWAIGNAGGGEVSSGSIARSADGGYSSGAGGYGNAKAGNCVKGGAGGGGAGSGAGLGGTSVSGGNGGAGSTSVSGASGLIPGGGGGSTSGGTFGGAGGAGRVRVWAW